MQRRRTKLIYTAGPYRSKDGIRGVVENIRAAESWMAMIWEAGASVICPHKNTALLDGISGMKAEDWLDGDFVQVERCDAVFLLPGWEDSEGTRQEIEVAKAAGVRIFDWRNYQELLDWINE